MKTVSARRANREFSALLLRAERGEEIQQNGASPSPCLALVGHRP
jgi:antitoxin (DNA-binding transcriptional repressor) of toxin-antitoxin stability system